MTRRPLELSNDGAVGTNDRDVEEEIKDVRPIKTTLEAGFRSAIASFYGTAFRTVDTKEAEKAGSWLRILTLTFGGFEMATSSEAFS